MLAAKLLGYFLSVPCFLQQRFLGSDPLACHVSKTGNSQHDFASIEVMEADNGVWTAQRMAREDVVEAIHDFGRNLESKDFLPATLKGRNEIINGRNVSRPLVWGEEQLRIELPRLESSKRDQWLTPSISINKDFSRVA